MTSPASFSYFKLVHYIHPPQHTSNLHNFSFTASCISCGKFLAYKCDFRRNTLIEYGEKHKIIVSTVGLYIPDRESNKIITVGAGRYYETMVFKAKFGKLYWDSDVTKQIYINSDWYINHCEYHADAEANEMHENIIKEISVKLKNGIKLEYCK